MTHIVRKPAASSQRLNQLGQYASSPDHMGLAVTQNLLFSSLAVISGYSSSWKSPHRYGKSHAIRDHTVLAATWQR